MADSVFLKASYLFDYELIKISLHLYYLFHHTCLQCMYLCTYSDLLGAANFCFVFGGSEVKYEL